MNKRFVDRLLATQAGFGPLALRIPVGIIFVAHGAQKLFGAFGGYGLEGTGQWMASIGLAPGYLMALLAGSAEFFGGLALLLGLLVRPAAAALAFAMVVAIFAVHIDKGLFTSNNGYEFGLSLLAAAVALGASRSTAPGPCAWPAAAEPGRVGRTAARSAGHRRRLPRRTGEGQERAPPRSPDPALLRGLQRGRARCRDELLPARRGALLPAGPARDPMARHRP
jgi:putative oxidoreductase